MFARNGPTFFELIHQSLCSTQKGYDLLAPKFDMTPFVTPDELLIPAMDCLGEFDAALDLCCGTGATMRALYPHCRKRVTGVDFSAGMLAEAKRKMQGLQGTARVEFVESDIYRTTFLEEFDVAACFGALGHILPQDERRFLQLIYRALKPGGRFVFVTGYDPPLFAPRHLMLRAFNGIMRVRNALIKPPFIMYYLNFMLPGVQVMLEEEGFAVEVRSGLFPEPFHRYHLVIATKPAIRAGSNST